MYLASIATFAMRSAALAHIAVAEMMGCDGDRNKGEGLLGLVDSLIDELNQRVAS